ncbi:ABC transporter substrate-binding protein [Kitasatospora sp. NPDC004240]
MRRSRSTALTALAAAAVLVVTGCSSDAKKSADGKGTNTSGSGANAATGKVVNVSDKKGGTVVYEHSDVPDSFDPGNTYYAYMYNFSRLYARPLTTFKPSAGEDGNTLVPDLAEALGQPSDGGKTWTYKIRKGLKYDDGSPITAKDVKYAVERAGGFAPDVFSNGPTYFKERLVDNPTPYEGPYKDKSPEGLKSIETPDDFTIVFHLKEAFADFDYLVSTPQTAPVPQEKDKGADYQKSIVSSGSYKFESFEQDKQVVLVRNPNWSAETDPIRKQLPDKIVVKLKVSQSTIDQDLMSGAATVDLAGKGVDRQTQAKLLTDAKLKAQTDNAQGGRLAYVAINSKVAPFDNLDCRKAVQYAIDKVSVQTASGGPIRGDIASTFLPPDIPGYQKFDTYATPENKGDANKAKDALKACGKEGGFTTSISARSDRSGEVDAATAVKASLEKVGIKVEIQQYPQGKYFSDYAGVPKFTEEKGIGLMMMQWGADWPTGYGYLQQVVDGAAIKASGNTNLSQLNDPAVNKLITEAIANTDKAAREKAYAEIDKKVMDSAVIVPLMYFKVLLFRPDNATNMGSTPAFSGQYDYLNIGTTK